MVLLEILNSGVFCIVAILTGILGTMVGIYVVGSSHTSEYMDRKYKDDKDCDSLRDNLPTPSRGGRN